MKHSIRLDVYNDNHDVFNKAFSEGVNKISGMLLFSRLKKHCSTLHYCLEKAGYVMYSSDWVVIRVVFSTFFRQACQVNCRNFELDENFS